MPRSNSSTAVLVDTNVISRALLPRHISGKSVTAAEWRDALLGRSIVMAVQTRVELLVWPDLADWGPARREALAAWVAAVPVVDVTLDVQAAYVDLTARAKRSGHAIADRTHVADRWIAATALATKLPLASDDGIFFGIQDLELIGPGGS